MANARSSRIRFVTFIALLAGGLAPVAASAGTQSAVPRAAVQTHFQAGPSGKAISCAAASACAASTARPSAAAKAAVTGKTDLSSKIVSIALSQIGEATTPAETSFNGIDCDPYSTLDAATSPNADGCGPDATYRIENQNEAWCSDFAKWVWAQAGVTADMNTLNAGADSFYSWALDQGQTPVPDSGTPEPGDAVLFYKPGPIAANTYADHVGLITSVNADGTVDMANGDFLGPNGITVEYNQNLDLSTWPSTVWSQGEQYVIVAPPTAAQQPNPTASVAGPTSAVAGTTVDFSAQAAESGGTISQYYWTFNDGRKNNTAGQQVSHVFPRAGLYTVTMTATSSFGTATTKTWNIGVSAGPSAVSSVPNNAVWYTTDPVMQYEFTRGSNGALAADSWDGAAWLQQDEPGSPAAGSPITGLAYSDADAGYAIAPHAYYRTTSGALGETYRGTSGWASATLPGDPAAQSTIQALATNRSSLNVTPSVYFFDSAGHLNATTESGGTWSTSAFTHLPTTSSPGSLAVTSGYVFYRDSAGDLVTATDQGRLLSCIPNPLGVRPGSALSAATTDAGIDVYFIDTAGNLADAHAESPTSSQGPGAWTVTEIPGAPAGSSSSSSSSSLTANGNEVFYLTASGTPGVTSWNGSSWQSQTLPGDASEIVGATADQLFITDSSGLALDTAAGSTAGGTSGSPAWTYSTLPNTPTSYPGTVLLYAATPADQATALAAASYAGLPASQVSTNFDTAWAAAVSGDYLVIGVGQAATAALFDNPCGWANPSQSDPGSTPFSDVKHAVNTPLTNLFVVGTAADPTQQTAAVDDLAFYAVNGTLPVGATLPTLASPSHTCSGTAS